MSRVTSITRRPKPDSQDLASFLMIIGQYRTGTRISVEMLRDDLQAAQIKPASYPGLFNAACRRGELEPTGQIARCKPASRRGGYAQIYRKTRPQPASRPAGRSGSKGPRR